jgi:hypothetical protein
MGYFVVFRCNRYFLQQEMMSQIRSGKFHDEMVLLKIVHPEQAKTFRRIDRKEFRWFGKLYDIVVERKAGDTTFFYCFHDKKEENLLNNFAFFLRRSGHDPSSRKDNPVQVLLNNMVTLALVNQVTIPVPSSSSVFRYPEVISRILPVYLVHVAPPPEIV